MRAELQAVQSNRTTEGRGNGSDRGALRGEDELDMEEAEGVWSELLQSRFELSFLINYKGCCQAVQFAKQDIPSTNHRVF